MNPIIIFLILSLSVIVNSRDLPETFLKCRKSDPNADECMKNAVSSAVKQMKDGLPEYNIVPLDPLAVNSLVLASGDSSPVKLKQIFENIQIYNLTNSEISEFRLDSKRNIMTGTSFTPALEFIADYIMEGNILLMPIVGSGKANITLVGLTVEHKIIGERIIRNQEVYFNVVEYYVELAPRRVIYNFDNLFNGDVILGQAVNIVMNENWQSVFKATQEDCQAQLGNIFKRIADQIFIRVPMDKIFLP